MRRNSDSKLDSFIEVGRQRININMIQSMSKNPNPNQQTVPEDIMDEFSIGINMKSVFSLGETRNTSRSKKENRNAMEDILRSTNCKNDLSLALVMNSCILNPTSRRSITRQHSF